MNKKPLSCILLTIASLFLSTQSTCMEKELSCMPNPLYYQKLMNNIEEQLVIKEIERYGIRHVEQTLYRGIQKQFLYKTQNNPVLIIKKTFFKPKRKKDQLTQSIFAAIQLHSKLYQSELPKQYLSDQIRYYVIKDKPAVLVVAKLTNKEHIQKIIDRYKKTPLANKEFEKIPSMDNNINPCQTICLTVSVACLLCYLLAIAQVMV